MDPDDFWTLYAAQAAQQIEVMTQAYLQTAEFTASAYIERTAQALIVASVAAVRVGDLAVAAWAQAVSGVPQPALGLLPEPAEQDRIVRAASTLHANYVAVGETQSRLDRLQRAEWASRQLNLMADGITKENGRDAYLEALKQRGIKTWTRVLGTNPCEGCKALKAEEGDAVPVEVRIWCHPGCKCKFVPAKREERTWGERVKGDSFGLRREWEDGTTFKAGLSFERMESA